jgi:hypothetical protein
LRSTTSALRLFAPGVLSRFLMRRVVRMGRARAYVRQLLLRLAQIHHRSRQASLDGLARVRDDAAQRPPNLLRVACRSVVLRARGRTPSIVFFNAESVIVAGSNAIALTWEVRDSARVRVQPDIGAVADQGGLLLVRSPGAYAFVLEAIGGGVRRQAKVSCYVSARSRAPRGIPRPDSPIALGPSTRLTSAPVSVGRANVSGLARLLRRYVPTTHVPRVSGTRIMAGPRLDSIRATIAALPRSIRPYAARADAGVP